jgi:hypothetical protein
MAKVKITSWVDETEFWSAIMGSGWESWEWWKDISYRGSADWDKPGVVTLTAYDPDTGEDEYTADLTIAELVKAYEEVNTTTRIHWEDLDSVSGDAILQVAVLGDIVYG